MSQQTVIARNGRRWMIMNVTETIIEYLLKTYQPDGIITYGSFADGSANENSDFDALVIAGHEKTHDASVIGNTVLDVFVYPAKTFQAEYDPEDFLQVYDGKIILDKTGTAGQLKNRILDYIDSIPAKTAEEIRQELDWCGKMYARTLRGDAEGYYRWHWLLSDSLEIYADIRGLHYFGPKKTLRLMEQSDPESFRICSQALKELNREYLSDWLSRLTKLSAGVSD